MGAVILIQSSGIAVGGGDVTPGATAWNDVVVTNLNGQETTNEVTFSGLTSTISTKFAWTSTSGNPTTIGSVKNGALVGGLQTSPGYVNISSADKLAFLLDNSYTDPSGNYDTGTVRVSNESRTATITVTIASPAVFTWTGHGFSANDKILFRTTGALPTGLTAETVYYVIAAGLTADEFEISATEGGAAINSSGSQSGVHTGVSVLDIFDFAVRYVPGAP